MKKKKKPKKNCKDTLVIKDKGLSKTNKIKIEKYLLRHSDFKTVKGIRRYEYKVYSLSGRIRRLINASPEFRYKNMSRWAYENFYKAINKEEKRREHYRYLRRTLTRTRGKPYTNLMIYNYIVKELLKPNVLLKVKMKVKADIIIQVSKKPTPAHIDTVFEGDFFGWRQFRGFLLNAKDMIMYILLSTNPVGAFVDKNIRELVRAYTRGYWDSRYALHIKCLEIDIKAIHLKRVSRRYYIPRVLGK